MKEEHKKLIEHIISEFKKSESRIIHRQDLDDMFPNIDTKGVVFNIILKNLKLIDFVVGENYNYTLTKAGYDFISFEDIEAKELALIERENAELENIKTSTKVNKFFLKTKWLPHIVSIVSLIFAIYIYFDSKADSKKLENRIEMLEKIKK